MSCQDIFGIKKVTIVTKMDDVSHTIFVFQLSNRRISILPKMKGQIVVFNKYEYVIIIRIVYLIIAVFDSSNFEECLINRQA